METFIDLSADVSGVSNDELAVVVDEVLNVICLRLIRRLASWRIRSISSLLNWLSSVLEVLSISC